MTWTKPIIGCITWYNMLFWGHIMSDRKGKNFSVSFKEKELDAIGQHLAELEKETGYKLSRNEFIRRAALATMNYQKLGDKNDFGYAEVYKTTG